VPPSDGAEFSVGDRARIKAAPVGIHIVTHASWSQPRACWIYLLRGQPAKFTAAELEWSAADDAQEFVSALDFDEEAFRAGFVDETGDTSYALFRCPHCARLHVAANFYEGDTAVHSDPVNPRRSVTSGDFRCGCGKEMPAGFWDVRASAWHVTVAELRASEWRWLTPRTR